MTAEHGGLKSETFGNGMVHGLDYNHRLQAKQVTLKQNSSATTPLQQYDYGYGEFNTSTGAVDTSKNNGQIGKITGTIGTTTQWLQGFRYDELGRLSNVAEYQSGNMSSQTYSQSYTYDRYGNRFQSANSTLGLQAVSSSEINAASNRFINSGSTPTSYDAAGNITTDTKFRNFKYEYDANGRQSAVKLLDNTNVQSSVYDCAGQRVQTSANGTIRTMVYDIFGQEVADYLGSSGATLERENIYRGGQLLSVVETPTATAPSALSATPSNGGSSITLSWSAASGATNYRVERKGAGGSYGLLGTTASTSMTDGGVSSGSAYLYKVCAADGQNNCTSNYTNVALGAAVSFTDDPLTIGVTAVKAQHITELRQVVNAVRSLAGLSAATWTNTTLTAGVTVISADDVRDLRSKLDEALVALAIQTSSYTDPTLATGQNGTLIKKTHVTELRERTSSGSGATGSGGSSGGVQYMLSDVQGSSRVVMNNSGVGTSTISARHDYLPFGQEIGSGTGLRSGTQGYSASDTNRQKYGLTERDDTTGLDHTWFRKYESLSGRWTSPDPLGGSIADPQSFNRYSYVQNDPVNLIDPLGLFCVDYERWDEKTATLYVWSECYLEDGGTGGYIPPSGGWPAGDPGGGTGGGGQGPAPGFDKNLGTPPPNSYGCDLKLAGIFGGRGAVADSGRTPSTLLHSSAGIQRFPEHSAEGGVIHLYTNAQGTSAVVGLYVPPGFSRVPGGSGVERYPLDSKINPGQVNYNYSRYSNSAGITISFVHIGPPAGPSTNAFGSTRVGSIAGPGGDAENGYNHTHINFYSDFATRTRVDPRTLFCKEFGF